MNGEHTKADAPPTEDLRRFVLVRDPSRPLGVGMEHSRTGPWVPYEDVQGLLTFARAVCAGKARWEAFISDPKQGEVIVDGLRYATRLEDGFPVLHPPLRSALDRSLGVTT